MKMYRGDLKPDLQVNCTDDGVPVDLTTANSIRIIGMRGGTELFDRTVTGTSGGVVTMEWEAADTSETGRISVEVEVTWPGSKPQTFRPASVVEVVPDFG